MARPDDEREAGEKAALLDEVVASTPISARAVGDLRSGDVATELAAVGERLDLLVCGSRGRGHARQVVLGSVSGSLVVSAPCPVLVVPSGNGRPHQPA